MSNVNNKSFKDVCQSEAPKKATKWEKNGRGFLTSSCGRYDIQPLFFGCDKVQQYQLTDNSRVHDQAMRKTQTQCKRIVDNIWNKPTTTLC